MNFSALLGTVATIFLILASGFVLRKINIIDDAFSKGLSTLILKLGQPFMLINSLIKCEYSVENLKLGFIVLALSVAMHIGMAVYSYLAVFKYKSLDERKISEFAIIFSNCGFIGIPIAESLFGPIGGFLCAFYCVPFQMFVWTWGIVILARKREDIKIKLKSIFVNFGSVPSVIGIALYASTLQMPDFLISFTGYLGSLCTPISLLITGALIAKCTAKELFADPKIYYTCFHKLLLLPAVVALALTFMGLSEMLVVFGTLMAAMPCASVVTMLCELHAIKPRYAATCVGVSSLISVAQILVGFVR